ncbi:hypothetical protein [Naasia lichenicola]|uniref:Uncharacterized protein n=1 Tax=Naasia lichenicola TaxID=2565933 RepID=A0A4V3WSL8_9MICO|nr:hypothetical protein [Naasia lichenicola]THG28507.1 hypothetical protein E6C64_16930 [Naasia lichenicola]
MSERSRSRTAAVLIAGLATVLVLVACAPTAEAPTPTASSTAPTPFFASDEEALAAATAAYESYLEVSDQIAADGGADPTALKPLVSVEEYERQEQSFLGFTERGLHAEGSSQVDSERLEQANLVVGNVSIYLCLDVSEVRLMDDAGVDNTPVDRMDRLPLQVAFASEGESLLISQSSVWSGDNFC